MEEPAELDDPEDLREPSIAPDPAKEEARRKRREALEAEAGEWLGGPADILRLRLRDVLVGQAKVSSEVLVRISRTAYEAGDRRTLNAAFEALSKQATPLLLHQAWGRRKEERQQQAQEVLMRLFEGIKSGKAGYAEVNFAGYTRRRAVDLYRAHKARFEGQQTRVEPTEEADPLDSTEDQGVSAEDKVAIRQALEKLPPKLWTVFIQIHQLGMTQDEVAAHHAVQDRTIRNWLRECAEILSPPGDDNAR